MNILIIIAICVGGFLLFLFILYWLLAILAQCCMYPQCKDSRDMNGKLVIVTGGTAGIGTECVYDLYIKGAKVVFTGRNSRNVKSIILPELETRLSKLMNNSSSTVPEFLKERHQELKAGKWDQNDNFDSKYLFFRKLDQSSLKDCKAFCDWTKGNFDSLDTLHNNAGLMLESYKETQDGFEFMMGVNHYSHYLITHELLPLIKASPRCRVVNTSSIMSHKVAGVDPYIDLDDLEWKKSNQKFDGPHRYANSKLANVLFTVALSRYFKDNKIEAKAVSLHPGAIKTSIWRGVETCFNKCMMCFLKPCFGNVKDGCQTNLACIYRDYDQLDDAKYYDRLKVAKINPVAEDEKYVLRFWDLSRQQIKLKGGFDLAEFPYFLEGGNADLPGGDADKKALNAAV